MDTTLLASPAVTDGLVDLPHVDLSRTPETSALLDALRPHAEKALAFAYGGRRTMPGFHVTEIKAARYDALDCGTNREEWAETIFQVWDVPGGPDERTMTAGKLLGIYGKTSTMLPLAPESPAVFEVGDSTSAAGRYTASAVRVEGDAVVVVLDVLAASCKPQDRWQQAERARALLAATPGASAASACCGPTPAAGGPCCN